jgi:4-hydroxy-tetrahydrodipicolinate synthase
MDHPSAWLAGYMPDLPTPFDQNDKIDLASFERLCERQIDAGTTALVVGETTGESSTLTPAEHDLIVRAAVKTSRGRVRIIAGAGSNSTSQAVALTRRAEADGADAILSVVPYYNKPMQAGIYAHFRAIAESTALRTIMVGSRQKLSRFLRRGPMTRSGFKKRRPSALTRTGFLKLA